MKRKNFQKLYLIKVFFIILMCFILTSCLEVKQRININKDGSGIARLEITILKGALLDPKAILELKEELKREGWKIDKERKEKGKYIIFAKKKFENVTELNDEETEYTFSTERRGFMKTSYTFKVEFIKSPQIPFPVEITVKMPGRIVETDGKKISSNEARWNLQYFTRGTELFVESSGFTIPVFVLVATIGGFLLLFAGIIIFGKIRKPAVSKYGVIFCTQCGKGNPANASFCTNCGQRVE